MKFLITGGLGFMGSNFIKYLLHTYPNCEVINLDKITYAGNPDNLKDVENDPRYFFIKGDIADGRIVDMVARDVDCIINYAAETHVDRSILNPDAFLKTDVYGTYNLLEAVKKFAIPLMIQISTDEVYGEIMEGEADEHAPLHASSPYAASKAAGDLLIESYRRSYNVPVILTRSCNFMGANQYPEKLLPLFITNLFEGKKVPMYGDGSQIREWIFASDHCGAIDFLRQHGKIGEIYNIGTGERRTNLEVTHIILQVMGKGTNMIEYVQDRPGHDRRYAVNSGKMKNLGWKPEITFEEGIKRCIEWYGNNRTWWQHLKSGAYLEFYKRQYRR